MLAALTHDQFARVLGNSRGLALALRPRAILTAREAVADEELRRLMDDAVARRFAAPLRVLAACADALESHPASRADVLCMTIATQMTEADRDWLLPLTQALGYHPDMAQHAAAGLRSKLAQALEPHLTECPPDTWRTWLTAHWRTLFPAVLTDWLASDPVESSRRLLGNYETFEQAAPTPTSPAAWREVAHTALTQPREHILSPLGQRSIVRCAQASAQTLRRVRDAGR